MGQITYKCMLIIGGFLLVQGMVSCKYTQKTDIIQPNILFIAVDDLRPELGCYGQNHIISPNIDKLAGEGLTFKNAYCNVPVCGASRASLLTGIRPTASRFVGYNTYAQTDVPDAISLPEHFKNNGYYTVSLGKIFHHIDDIPESWSEKPWSPAEQAGSYLNYASEENKQLMAAGEKRGLPYDVADVDDETYFDGQLAARAIKTLNRLKKLNKPFFLGAGFFKPHLPFNAPQKYWDLYAKESIHLPKNYFAPVNAPDIAIHNFGELRSYFGVPPDGPVSDEMAHKLIHGYYACVSYLDAQIGRVLDELDRLGLAENTIVVLWGDHGWQLGEHSLWCKHANFKTSLNAPLIVKSPAFKGNIKTDELVEFIDIFPALCELSGLPLLDQLQGKSFIPLFKNPGIAVKEAVFPRYVTGESVVTKDFIYTEWFLNKRGSNARMLYDQNNDPHENNNVAESEELKKKIEDFHTQLIQLRETR